MNTTTAKVQFPQCPKCQQAGGTWLVRRLEHSRERAVECPSCGTLLTEQFLRDVQGVTLPGDADA